MIKRERKGKTNAGREIKSRRGTGSQQHLIPREWSMSGVIGEENKVVGVSVQRWTLAQSATNSRWMRSDNCWLAAGGLSLASPAIHHDIFHTKQKKGLWLFCQNFRHFFDNQQPNQPANVGAFKSLSLPPARSTTNFDSGICSRQKIVNDSPSLFGNSCICLSRSTRLGSFFYFFFSIRLTF
jgi:hypothetical protein